MVTASPRGQPCPIAVSGVVEVICEDTTGTLGFMVVCCATEGNVHVAGLADSGGNSTASTSYRLGYVAENFTGNTTEDKIKIILSPGRR
jgi:hypothetical protein